MALEYSEYLAKSDDEDDRALQALWKSLEEARARRASHLFGSSGDGSMLRLLCVSSQRPSQRLHWQRIVVRHAWARRARRQVLLTTRWAAWMLGRLPMLGRRLLLHHRRTMPRPRWIPSRTTTRLHFVGCRASRRGSSTIVSMVRLVRGRHCPMARSRAAATSRLAVWCQLVCSHLVHRLMVLRRVLPVVMQRRLRRRRREQRLERRQRLSRRRRLRRRQRLRQRRRRRRWQQLRPWWLRSQMTNLTRSR